MASIAKRPDGQWRARYRDSAGKEHSRHFARKIDAQQWLDSVTTSVRTGMYVDPKAGQMTVGEWAQRWFATKADLKATTKRTYEGLMRTHILPDWATVKLSDVTHEAVAAWTAGLSGKGLSASTVRQTHRVLSLVLALAVKDGRLARNAADGVPLPRAAKADHVYLTHAQLADLADAAGDARTVILFLGYTGVRYGEMAALRVRRLDLLRRRADIAEAVADVNGRAVFDTPKTHTRRAVPIPRSLIDELAALVAGKGPDDFVFSAQKGGVLHLRNFRRSTFDPAVRAARLDGLTPHALRHTAASLAIASGANVKVVQRMLGHRSATMTLDLYGHLMPDQLDEVADAMDSARAAADSLRTKGDVILMQHGPRKAVGQ